MKQLFIFFGFLILSAAFFYIWKKVKVQIPLSDLRNRPTNNKLKNMEIKGTDIEQTKNNEDILYDLIQKYYPEYDDEKFEELDIVAQTFVLIVDADGQINNGGIVQFIDNGSGNRFHETVDAAKRINSEILVGILTRAAKQFPNAKIPKNWDKRRDLFDELTDKYTTYKTFEELSSEEKQIVLEHRKKFGDTIPVDQCSYAQKNSWNDTWEELDSLYYGNSKFIYQDLIDFLKKNAKLID